MPRSVLTAMTFLAMALLACTLEREFGDGRRPPSRIASQLEAGP